MNNPTKKLIAAAGLALLATVGDGAHAQAGTGSLAGWSVLGDAAARGGAITVTSAFLDGAGDAAHNLSGSSAAGIGAVEAAAGVAPFGFDLPGDHHGTEGSLVGQSFAATAGQTLAFDWSFASFDDTFLDHAFVVIGGRVFTLATTAEPGASSQRFSHLFAQGGPVTLAFGVVDTDDVDGVSSLRISNLAVTAAVPEPSTYAMLLGGLGLIGFAAKRGLNRHGAALPDRAR